MAVDAIFIYHYTVILISYFQCYPYPVPPWECPQEVFVVDTVAPGQACLYKYFSFPLSVSFYHYFIFTFHLSTADIT
jgi:hypothetical protein